MSLVTLPFDVLSLIINKLNRHEILLINRISHSINNFYYSNDFQNVMISKIKDDMNLDFSKYSFEQLKNIFIMTNPNILCHEFFLNEGNIYHIKRKSIGLILNKHNIIQINEFYALDNKGFIYDINCGEIISIDRIYGIDNIIKLLAINYVLDNKGNSLYLRPMIHGVKITVLPNSNHIIKYDNYQLNNKGIIYDDDVILDDSRCYVQISRGILLDDMGYLYSIDSGEINLIHGINNIIKIVDGYSNLCSALDNKGIVYYIDFHNANINIISLEIDNIIDISTNGRGFFALDYYKNIHIIAVDCSRHQAYIKHTLKFDIKQFI